MKPKSYIESYKNLAQSKDFHELAGRRKQRTDFMNAMIIKKMQFNSDDNVLDIGCGDASLLTAIRTNIASGVGTCATEEEAMRLQQEFPGLENIKFIQCRSDSLPCNDRSFNKIVCNGVLLLLDSLPTVEKSLNEIQRVAKAGAMIWIGEVLFERKLHERQRANRRAPITLSEAVGRLMAQIRTSKGLSPTIVKRIINHAFRRLGVKSPTVPTFMKSALSKARLIVPPELGPLSISPARFAIMCDRNTFRILEQSRYDFTPDRSNYLLMKT
jgi:ubiquinone/menaquinone biosynthesis C-methylase UbiE